MSISVTECVSEGRNREMFLTLTLAEGDILGDVLDVGLEGKRGVQDDSQVAHLRRWGNGAAIHNKDQVSDLPEQWCRGHHHELCPLTV